MKLFFALFVWFCGLLCIGAGLPPHWRAVFGLALIAYSGLGALVCALYCLRQFLLSGRKAGTSRTGTATPAASDIAANLSGASRHVPHGHLGRAPGALSGQIFHPEKHERTTTL